MHDALDQHDRVDSLNSLAAGLQKLLQNYGQNVVLVLEGIDRQRGASQTLLPALTRLGETVHGNLGPLERYFAIY